MREHIQELNKLIFSSGYIDNYWSKEYDEGNIYYEKILYDDLVFNFVNILDDNEVELKSYIQKHSDKFDKIFSDFVLHPSSYLTDNNDYSVKLSICFLKCEYEDIILPIIKYLKDNQIENISDLYRYGGSIKKLSGDTEIPFEKCEYIIENISGIFKVYTHKIAQSQSLNNGQSR